MKRNRVSKIEKNKQLKEEKLYSAEDVLNYKITVWDSFISSVWFTPKRRLKDILYEIKYAIQRVIKGYDSTDTFEFWHNFCKRTSRILDDIANNHYGYPSRMTNEEYTKKLNEMSNYLKSIIEVEEDYESDLTFNEQYEKQNEYKDKFMSLFSELFFDLWD